MKKRVRAGTHHFWKGGKTAERQRIYNSLRYKLWRTAVFRRDDYTCQHCGKRGGRLQADHIKPFAYFPASRFNVSNGRTLCIDCHRKTPTFGRRATQAHLQEIGILK